MSNNHIDITLDSSTINPYEYILKIEQELVKFILELSSFRSQNTKQSHLKAFFVFNDKLTQEELYKLTKISRGTISENLNVLLEQNELISEYNAETKRKEYRLNPKKMESSLAISHGKEKLLVEINYFNEKIEEIKAQSNLEAKQERFLIGRLKEIILSYELLAYFSDWTNLNLQNKGNIKPFKINKFLNDLQSINTPTPYPSQSTEIETKIVNHLKDHQILRHHSEITSEILAYFYLRSDLTQLEVKDLTNFSTGRISQTFKELEHFQYIKKAIPKKRPYHYILKSILLANLRLLKQSTLHLLKWQEKLSEIKSSLEEKEDIFKENVAYPKILRFLSGIFMFIPIYRQVLEEINNYV